MLLTFPASAVRSENRYVVEIESPERVPDFTLTVPERGEDEGRVLSIRLKLESQTS